MALPDATLWKFQVQRFGHLLQDLQKIPDVAAIHVFDDAGHPLAEYGYTAREASAWWNVYAPRARAAIVFNNRSLGAAEVTLSRGQLLAKTILVLALSVALGLALGIVGHRFPVRTATRLEQRLDDSLEATALANTETERMRQAAVRRSEQLDSLLAASRIIVEELDLQQNLDRIAVEAARIAGTPHVKILLVDDAKRELRPAVTLGRTEQPDLQPRLKQSLSGIVATSGKPLFVEDSQDESQNPNAAFDRQAGFRTYLGLPIKRGSEALGVITFNTETAHAYDADEMTLLSSFADHAAIAIKNARLYEATRRDLAERLKAEAALRRRLLLEEAVAQTSRALLSGERVDLGSMLGEIGRALSAARVHIYWLRADRDTADSEAEWWADGVVQTQAARQGLRREDFSWAAERTERGEVVAVPDVGALPDEASAARLFWQSLGVQAALVIPIATAEGVLLGFLDLEDTTRPRLWSDDEIRSLRVVTEMFSAHRQRRVVQAVRALLGMAVEQAAEGILITDPQGTIQYANPAFERMTGYALSELVGSNPRILKSGKQDDAFYRTLWETLLRGEVWSGSFVNKRKDGSLFEEETIISPVRDGTGPVAHYVAVKRDVTRERQMEAELRQAQKMEAIGRLAGGVAHDFNNLLTAVLGYADLLHLHLRPGDPARESVEEIRLAAERAAELTRQLLAFGRRQILQPRGLDLNRLIERLANLLRRTLGEEISVVTTLVQEPALIFADPGQIEQAIIALALNARDAMDGKGSLYLATALTPPADAAGEGAPARRVTVTVRDTGAGMDEEMLAHIFEPFYGAKPIGQGAGLGLAMVHGIVEQSDGSVSVSSRPKEGTTFTLTFPYVPKAAVPPARVPFRAARVTETGTVLLAEDEASVRSLLAGVLRAQGYTVLEAGSGPEALAETAGRTDPIHLLVTDVIMPGMSGQELAQRMRAIHPGIRVIFMSGYSAEAIGRHGALDPGTTFLQKPFGPGVLVAKAREVLAGR